MDYETCALPTELTRLYGLTCLTQLMVSIHRPLGYGPSTLPLRQIALKMGKGRPVYAVRPLGRTGIRTLDLLHPKQESYP